MRCGRACTGSEETESAHVDSRRTIVCYFTVTSVPIGISEKNLRAASEGSRIQPCEAGRFDTYPACIPKSRQLRRMKYCISTWEIVGRWVRFLSGIEKCR